MSNKYEVIVDLKDGLNHIFEIDDLETARNVASQIIAGGVLLPNKDQGCDLFYPVHEIYRVKIKTLILDQMKMTEEILPEDISDSIEKLDKEISQKEIVNESGKQN